MPRSAKNDVAHLRVVVLAGVHERHAEAIAALQLDEDRRGLHEVRPRPGDERDAERGGACRHRQVPGAASVAAAGAAPRAIDSSMMRHASSSPSQPRTSVGRFSSSL